MKLGAGQALALTRPHFREPLFERRSRRFPRPFWAEFRPPLLAGVVCATASSRCSSVYGASPTSAVGLSRCHVPQEKPRERGYGYKESIAHFTRPQRPGLDSEPRLLGKARKRA